MEVTIVLPKPAGPEAAPANDGSARSAGFPAGGAKGGHAFRRIFGALVGRQNPAEGSDGLRTDGVEAEAAGELRGEAADAVAAGLSWAESALAVMAPAIPLQKAAPAADQAVSPVASPEGPAGVTVAAEAISSDPRSALAAVGPDEAPAMPEAAKGVGIDGAFRPASADGASFHPASADGGSVKAVPADVSQPSDLSEGVAGEGRPGQAEGFAEANAAHGHAASPKPETGGVFVFDKGRSPGAGGPLPDAGAPTAEGLAAEGVGSAARDDAGRQTGAAPEHGLHQAVPAGSTPEQPVGAPGGPGATAEPEGAVTVRELFDRLVSHASVHRGPEGTILHLHLQPEHLGRVQVHLSWQGQALSAQFVVDHPEAWRVLEAGLADLQQLLRREGLEVAGLNVALGHERQSGGRREDGGAGQAPAAVRPVAGFVTAAVPAVTRDTGRVPGEGRLDYLV